MRPFNPDGVLAFFISFRCYGTWMHGDERGSMNRTDRNTYGTPRIPADPLRNKYERQIRKYPAFKLNRAMRQLVEQTIREVCAYRNWHLYAANAQDEHVHTVVCAIDSNPEKVLVDFKARATRRLRENPSLTLGLLHDQPIWSRHGSTVWLWTEMQVSNAINYTLTGQGEPPSTYQE